MSRTPTSPANSQQAAERFVRSVREECLDRLLVCDRARHFNTTDPIKNAGSSRPSMTRTSSRCQLTGWTGGGPSQGSSTSTGE